MQKLIEWYNINKRDLPWRENKDPYRIWVSEIMLQQTRVDTVVDYFNRFTARLPNIACLAECPEDELLKLWEGLGYYNRVRNMQIAARDVLDRFGGQFPYKQEDIESLKGIGSYTSGAIASIAYNAAVPAVDGNVLRIYMRVTGQEDDIAKAKTKKMVEQDIQAWIPQENAGDFTQALMDLGATICVPKGEVKCMKCPLSSACVALKDGRIDELPVKVKTLHRKIEARTVFLYERDHKVLIEKRPTTGLLASMYEFPNVKGHLEMNQARQEIRQRGISAIKITPIGSTKHIFSHLEWRMEGYLVKVDELELPSKAFKEGQFVSVEELDKIYSVPTAFSYYREKFLEHEMRIGNKEDNYEDE